MAVLTESKQQIDPRLHEMARFGGGGGGGGRYGGGGGRGGGRGRGSKLLRCDTTCRTRADGAITGWTGSNTAPMGRSRW